MPTDLNILKKAFQNASATYESVSPGNEPITRRESVQAEQVLGAPAIPNDVGGWVASGGFPYQSTEYLAGSATYPIQTGAMPSARGYSETNPGAAGYPDVDFVPYNWGTNRFGNKGGALLGHPISWEVVGPTAKSPYTHWQWAVDGTLNTISLEFGATTVVLTGGAGSVPTVKNAYNLSTGGISDYNGGLYVLVTLTGGEADSTGAGALLAPADPLTPLNPATSMFEVFRVKSYSGQKITLESSKPLSSYFTVPGANPKIRAITLIRPKVTRLAAFPLSVSGAQRNQVYVFLPPKTAARSELLPPYVGSGTCPDWSVNGIGGFVVSDGSYGGDAPLPVPLPLYRLDGYIAVSLNVLNQMQVYVTLVAGQSITQGQIVRVTSHAQDAVPVGKESHVFGYFESLTALGASGTLDLRRVPEVNPATGEVFYGPGPVGGFKDLVSVEVYDTIGTVFTDPVLNVAKVAASRLDHLIDPRNAPYTFQRFSGTDSPVGTTTPPGASIFDTVTGSPNPGNLTELGFRVVLFPAKEVLGDAVPDFNHPITSERVVLDPSLPATTVQTIEVDYSAGVLYLSHQPVPGAGCTVATGIYGTSGNNPRGEIVLFASCVPYSREETQRGGGIRVKATRPVSDLNPFGEHDAFDVYGRRCIADILTPVGAFISGTALAISLPTNEIPPLTGWFYFVEVVSGSVTTVSDPNYYSYYNGLNPGVLYVSVAGHSYVITANTKVVFVKGPWNQVPTTDLWYAGTTRGASKRANTVNFKGANVSLEADGSVTVQTVATLDEAYRAGDPFTPGAGRVITVDGGAVEAQPDNTAGGDTFNASFRVDTTAVTTNAAALVGFDFKGSGSIDPYAGFIDRRVFAPTTGDTVLADPFTCNVVGNVVTVTTGGNKFWTSLGVPRSLLMIPFDLIEIEGVTYLILSLDTALPAGSSVVIVNLDGTAVNLTLTGVTAKVYRTRFYTSRGNTGFYPLNFNSWFAAQSWSETLNDEPIGALNLFAGSNTAISPGDGGGSTASLAFWSKFVTGGNTLEVRSPTYFDTFGRLNSSLTRGYFNSSNLADYRYRGDFVTRAVKDTFSPADPVIGHIVEDYTYDQYRYDYLSLLPLLSTVLPYTATTTVNTNTNGELVLVTALNFKLIPYGSAILEVISVDGDTTKRGLYLVYSGKSLPSTTLYIRGLDHSTPIIGGVGQSVVFRLYAYSAQGRNVNAPYWDSYGVLARTHTPTHTIAVGSEANAVGLAINSPDMKTGTSGDRYAYRVSYGDAGTATQPSNNEIAALDSYGYHKAQDYLYLESRRITKQINPHLFNPVDYTNNPAWVWSPPPFPCWQGRGNNHDINIPLDLPRSSDRTDSVGTTRTHRTCLESITVNGQFHGGGANYATVRVFMVQSSTLLPLANSTALLLNGSILASFNLPNAGIDTSSTITITTNPGWLPVYIDDTTDYYYYAIVTSNNINGNTDLLYSVSVTYTDPGPKNY